MSVRDSANLEPIVSRNAVDEAVHDALRLFVGRGRRYSVKQLQAGTGVPERMIESAIAPLTSTEFRPLAREYLFSIMAFLRAPFASEILTRLCHVGAFDLPDDEAPGLPELIADSAASTAEIAEAGVDGKLGTDDHAELKAVGQRDIERGMHLVAISTPRRKTVLKAVNS